MVKRRQQAKEKVCKDCGRTEAQVKADHAKFISEFRKLAEKYNVETAVLGIIIHGIPSIEMGGGTKDAAFLLSLMGTRQTARLLEVLAESTGDAPRIVCVWGAHGAYFGRGVQVERLLKGLRLMRLGVTKAGEPQHPLYTAANTPLTFHAAR